MLQVSNTQALSVPASQQLADQWFQALGRGTGNAVDETLLVGTLDETSSRILPVLRTLVQTSQDNLDDLIRDSSGSSKFLRHAVNCFATAPPGSTIT